MDSEAPLIDVGGFDAVESSGHADEFVEWMEHQRARDNTSSVGLLRLTPADVVLDVGCGPGADLRSIGRAGAVGVGVDRATTMLSTARCHGAATACADACELPFRDQVFTAAHLRAVLVHCPQPGVVLAEVYRVLRPGGRVVMSEPDHGSHVVSTDELEIFERLLAHRRTTFQHPTIGRDLPQLASDAGLHVEGWKAVPIVFRKLSDARNAGGPFDVAVRNALDAGAISAQEAANYLASLDRRDTDGTFVFCALAITVVAKKPAPE